MQSPLLLANALLILSFGIPALIFPSAMFSPFGIMLDPSTEAVARGYAATLIGYGWALFRLRGAGDPNVVLTLLLSLLMFNVLEVALQVAALIGGQIGSMAWATIGAHGALAIWTGMALLRHRTGRA